jgi:hypothetical protein
MFGKISRNQDLFEHQRPPDVYIRPIIFQIIDESKERSPKGLFLHFHQFYPGGLALAVQALERRNILGKGMGSNSFGHTLITLPTVMRAAPGAGAHRIADDRAGYAL